jgi:hypothetical protein
MLRSTEGAKNADEIPEVHERLQIVAVPAFDLPVGFNVLEDTAHASRSVDRCGKCGGRAARETL